MKKLHVLILMLVVVFLPQLSIGAGNGYQAPKGLNYERVWTDKVDITWQQPNLPDGSKGQELGLGWRFLYSFECKKLIPNQQAVGSDGRFIYTASFNTPGMFLKYDMNGRFIEDFKIEGVQGIRDLTYDGKYFYGGAEGIFRIYKLDLANKKLISSMGVDSSVRHITYIPTLDNGNGGFEIGEWGSSELIKMDGTKIEDGFGVEYCYGSMFNSGKFYAFQQTGGSNGKQIVEFDYVTKNPTGEILDLSEHEGEWLIEPYHIAGGICCVEYPKGRKLALVNVQSGENIVLVFEIERFAKPQGLTGYDIYRNGIKINDKLIDADSTSFRYRDAGLQEGVDYEYKIKALYGANSSDFSEPLVVNLPSTSVLPFFENFETESVVDNYWNVTDVEGDCAWGVERINVAGDVVKHKMLRYRSSTYGNVYDQHLVSRKFDAGAATNVFMRYDIANICYHDDYQDTLYVDVFDGADWINVDRVGTKKGGFPIDTRTIDITDHAKGKMFNVRFRVAGNCNGGWLFDFLLDDIKVWTPAYCDVTGHVESHGVTVAGADVKLTKNDDIIKFDVTTDLEGRFMIENVETGEYTVKVRSEGYNDYVDNNLVLSEDNDELIFVMTQPKLTVEPEVIDIVVSPNKTLSKTLKINNVGDGDCEWSAEFRFPENENKSDEQWNVMTSFPMHANSELGVTLFKDHIYTYSSIPKKRLVKYSKTGEIIDPEIYLPDLTFYMSSLTSDDDYFYLIGGGKIVKYDIENNIYVDTIYLDMPLRYAAYDRRTGGFYAGGQYELYRLDSEGQVVETFNVGNANINSIAVDFYSEGGPYIWAYCPVRLPGFGTAVDNVTIKQFSIANNAFTDVAHSAIDVPGYVSPTGRNMANATGICGTTDYRTGRFTLIGSINYSPIQIPGLMFVYEMAKSVKWIDMKLYSGEVDAEGSAELKIDFDTFDMQSGDKCEATVLVRSNPGSDVLEIPVTMNVDIKADENCFVPSDLVGEVEDNEKVNLTWELKVPEDYDDETHLLGYNVYRGGKKRNVDLINVKEYVDVDPMLGVNTYAITAVYDFLCESYMSESVDVMVKFTGTCVNVESLSTEVVNQRHVSIAWDLPIVNADAMYDTFEDYDAFIINNIGDWEVRDLDGAVTYGFTYATFPNVGNPMAFMVFNPSKTTPAAPVEVYQGEQVLACFDSRVEGVGNNDWLISPELDFDNEFALNFMAKTHDSQYGLEKIKVAYSLGSNDIEEFVFLNDGNAYNVPNQWTEYSFKIPAEAKYVAVNCVSLNSFILLLDNIYIGDPKTYFSVDGYNLFKNGEKINNGLIKDQYFYDFSLEDGDYVYQIETVYKNTCVSDRSCDAVVEIDYTNKCNPVGGLEGEIIEQSVNLSWNAPTWSDPTILKYHNNMNDGGIGWQNGGDIYVGVKWSGKDLMFYEGYSFTSIEIFIAERAEVTVFVMSEGEILTSKNITGYNLNEFTVVTFDSPVLIDTSKEYIIGYKATHEKGMMPAGCDNSSAVDGKGNLISNDGNSWSSIIGVFGADFNFNWNISVIMEEVATIENTVDGVIDFRIDSMIDHKNVPVKKNIDLCAVSKLGRGNIYKSIDPILGFNVYKNGNPINDFPITDLYFTDDSKVVGKHKYYVTTNYANCGEIKSPEIVIEVPVSVCYESDSKIRVYTDNLNLFVEMPIECNFVVNVIDMMGGCVTSERFDMMSSATIKLDHISTGVYVVEVIKGNEEVETKKIVIR